LRPAKECFQEEIDGKEYDICGDCWNPWAEKLKGKGLVAALNAGDDPSCWSWCCNSWILSWIFSGDRSPSYRATRRLKRLKLLLDMSPLCSIRGGGRRLIARRNGRLRGN
jgi:hypothetical protein